MEGWLQSESDKVIMNDKIGGGMRRFRNSSFFWWVMVLLCCSMIFYFTSSHEYTYKETKKTVMKVVKDSKKADTVNWDIRKLAHVTLFGLLAFLVQRAMQTKKHSYIFAWIFAACYGIFDEWHQSFHPGRTPLISDVIIDSTAALGILIIAYSYHKRSYHKRKT